MSSLLLQNMQRWERMQLVDQQPLRGDEVGAARVSFVPVQCAGEYCTAILLERGVSAVVNGDPVFDLAVLADRDEIIVGKQRLYFSDESMPAVTVFHLEAGKRRPKCPACRGHILDGEQIVVCPRPGCGRPYHQSENREHWTYRPECALCGHPTSLTGESAWSPDAEEESEDRHVV